MKIGLLQLNPIVGDITGNTDKIILQANKLVTCDIIVAPELITVGYPPRDLLYRNDFITANLEARDRLVAFTKSIDAAFAFGYVEPNKEVGKPNFNAICIARHGKIIQQRYKTLLPTYDVFEEDIYFEPGSTEDTNFSPVTIAGKEVGFIICEEAWNDKDFWPTRRYNFDPVSKFAKNGANYIIAINASPYRRNVLETRHQMVSFHCKKHNLGFAYCNMVGYNDDVGFDGNSFVMNNSGQVIFQDVNFVESTSTVETLSPPLPFNSYDNDGWEMETVKAVTLGIRDYFGKQNITGPAIIGLSGGIDSALVAFLAQMALGQERVIGIGMPSEFSSGHSVTDAEKLAKTLGIKFAVVPIASMHNASRGAVDEVISQMKTGDKPCYLSGVTDENLQARERGKLLMAVSNYYNGLVLSTGNKSEIAVGYCVDGNSTIFTDQGVKIASEIYEIVQNGEYVSSQGNVFKHAYKTIKNDIVAITTKIGSKMVISSNHDVEVFNQSSRSIAFKKAKNLNTGDIISMRIGSNIWGNKLDLPVFEYIKKAFDYKSHNFQPPTRLSFRLAKFIGLCIADGSFSTGIYRIRTTKQEVSDFCKEYLKELDIPKTAWKITTKDDRGCFFVEIYSVQFNEWLRFMGVLHGAHNKLVPPCIADASPDIVKGFISGIMMDSTTNAKHKFAEITYHSVSEELTTMVQSLLLNLGILCYKKSYNRTYRKRPYLLHEIYIPASETVKMVDGFDFLKPSIASKIIANNNTIRCKHKSFAEGIYGYDDELQSLMKSLSWQDRGVLKGIIKSTGGVGRKTLLKYLQISTDKNKVLHDIAVSDHYFVKVKTIDRHSEEKEMFDFSMLDEPVYVVNNHRVHNCTIYGDMAGGLAVISDLVKTDVYDLCQWINKHFRNEIIPWNTINKLPSAELRPEQHDQQSLPPYELLDKVLQLYVEEYKSPQQIVDKLVTVEQEVIYQKAHGRDITKDILKVCSLICKSQFKRVQSPTGIKLTSKLFKMGYRMPIVHRWN